MLALLLPPSEGKAEGGALPGWDPAEGRFGPALTAARTEVVRALRRAKGGNQKLLGVGGATLDRARAVNRALVGAPTLPAWQRFTGVVWDHLDVGSLSVAARSRANESVVVLSAVAGLLALEDPVPDHRLKLSARLAPLGTMAAYWRSSLTPLLNEHLEGRLVIDLLPNEHRAAWQPAADRYDLRRIRLVDGAGRRVGHGAKAAKGLLARALIESDDPRRTLSRWRHDDFSVVLEDE